MKKTLIAAALGTLFAVPAMADTTVYGNFRASLNTGDLNGANNNASVVNNASRLGIKGSSGTDSLKGIYHLQMGANNDGGGAALSSRFYFAGLKGGFGKVIYGRLSTPYKMAGVKQDPFYDTSAGPANGGSNYGYSGLNNGFTDNTIAYYSPKIGGGLTFNGSLSIDDAATDGHDVGIGAEYATKKFKIGINHLQLDNVAVVAVNGGAESATRIYGGTKFGKVGVNASFETLDFGNGADGDFAHLNVSGKVGPKTKISGAIGSVSGNGTGARNAAGDSFAIGVFHNILKNTQLSAMYTSVDYDAATATDRDGVAFGVVQKF